MPIRLTPDPAGIRLSLKVVPAPEGMKAPQFYRPVERGLEIRIAEKLRELRALGRPQG